MVFGLFDWFGSSSFSFLRIRCRSLGSKLAWQVRSKNFWLNDDRIFAAVLSQGCGEFGEGGFDGVCLDDKG